MLSIYAMGDMGPVEVNDIGEDVWIKMTNPSKEEIARIQNALDIDVEVLTAALDDEEGSRAEVDIDYTLIVIDVPAQEWRNDKLEYTTFPLAIAITDTAIVTVSLVETLGMSGLIKNRVSVHGPVNIANRPRFVLQMLYKIAQDYQTDLKYIESRRLAMERAILIKTERDDLFELHELESNLVYFKTSLSVNSTVVGRLARQSRFVSSEEDKDLLDDVIIEVNQALEMTDTYSQIVKGTRQLVEADMNNSLSLVMKSLTIITLIMSIPTIIASFFGMNVRLPMADYYDMWKVIIVVMIVGCLIAAVFLRTGSLWRRKKVRFFSESA